MKCILSDDESYYLLSSIDATCPNEFVIRDTYNDLPIKEIGEKAFEGCQKITDITIPDSVTVIGEYVFSMCNELRNAVIGSGITIINKYSFQYCTSLMCVVISSSVIEIECGAFYFSKIKDIYYKGNEEE